MGLRLPAGAGIAGQALSEGRSLLMDDTHRQPDFLRSRRSPDGAEYAATDRHALACERTFHRRDGSHQQAHAARSRAADVRVLDHAGADRRRRHRQCAFVRSRNTTHRRSPPPQSRIKRACTPSPLRSASRLEIQDVLDAALMVLQPQFDYDGGCICLNGDETTPQAQAHHAPVRWHCTERIQLDRAGLHRTVDCRTSLCRCCRIPASSIGKAQRPGPP